MREFNFGGLTSMCGIAVVIGQGREAHAVAGPLVDLHRALAHRGPDDEAFLFVGADGRARRLHHDTGCSAETASARLAIAFRHLRVRDPSDAAAQPLCSEEGSHWIVMNGELYNADELRSQLASRGHAFRTRVDTEVALAAYQEWGTGCFERFDGMWALFVVDLVRGKLVGCRDRLGIKPMYYARDGDCLLFASEPQALATARHERPSPQTEQFSDFLIGLPPQAPDRTFFRGVRAVPAASLFEIGLDSPPPQQPRFRSFWDLHDFLPIHPTRPSFEDASAEVRRLLTASVAQRTEATVPVGCLLSGGLDSSYIARIMADQAHADGAQPVPAYSIVFDTPEMSELPFVWSVVRQGGLKSHTFELTTSGAWDDVETVVRAQGQPLLGQDLIAQYNAYRLARQHGSIVVLEGQGADELLAGIPSYAAVMLGELLSDRRLGAFARELWHQARTRNQPLPRALLSLARRRGRPANRTLDPEPSWLNPEATGNAHGDPQTWRPSGDRSILNRHLFQLVTRTNLPAVLQYQDRSSMVHGVESRVPYLDHKLVEYCFQLPSDYKVAGGVRKKVLLESARGVVSDAVIRRRDNKAFISSSDWIPLRTAHADALRAMASSSTMKTSSWFRPRQLAGHVDAYLRGLHDDGASVWRLYTAWQWMEAFGVS